MSEHDALKIDHRVKVALLVVSLATIATIVVAALQENVFSEWHTIRSGYVDLLEQKAGDEAGRNAAKHFKVEIAQNYVPALGAVDRCVTCHAGLDDPRMVDAAQPYATHPGRYLEIHAPEKFGCTICHEGQGRAVTVDDAHGRVPHWERPMLKPGHIETSCTKCHMASKVLGSSGLIAVASGNPAGNRLLAEGQDLLAERGCLGCHKIEDKGGKLGPDLSRVGDKVAHNFDFLHLDAHAPREISTWLRAHFLDPSAVSPGSAMPAVRDIDEADALTAYMLSLRAKHGGGTVYSGRASNSVTPSQDGRKIYLQYCSACHGESGKHSQVASISSPALHNTDTLAVADDDYLRMIIATGRGGTDMPAWGEGHGNLSRDEIDRIVGYIRSWEGQGAPISAMSSQRGSAERGRAYFRGLCTGCHGVNGEGGIGNNLRAETFLAVTDDRFLARSIVEGRPGTAMPSWKHLSAQAVSDILAFIRSWQPTPPSFEEVVVSMDEVPSSDNARFGKSIYSRNCASCHGRRGEGGLGPSITNDAFLRVVDDVYIYRAITLGRPSTAMPAWRHLSADDIGSLIAYLRSYQKSPPLPLETITQAGDYNVGAVYYQESCAECHGQAGVGAIGPQLSNQVFLDSASDEMLFQWIGHGRTGTAMRGFLPETQGVTTLSAGQIVDIIRYLRHTAAAGDLPVPRVGFGNPEIGALAYKENCSSCHGPDGEGASGPQLNNPALLAVASDGFLAATINLGRTDTAMQPMVRGQGGNAQIPPEHVEDIVAYIRQWEGPKTWRKTRSITVLTNDEIVSGQGSYLRHCSGCHGRNGEGQAGGPEYFAPALNNPQFLAAASDGFLLATIARGRGQTPMRPFGRGAGGIAELGPEEITNIVRFIRSWQSTSDAAAAGGKQ